MQGQGTGAHLAYFQKHRQTQPWPEASTLSGADRKTDALADTETKTLALPRSLGSLRTRCAGRTPLTPSLSHARRACHPWGNCLEELVAWVAVSAALCFRVTQEISHRCSGEKKRDIGRRRHTGVRAPPPPGTPLSSSLPYFPGTGRENLMCQTVETTN